LDRKKKEQQAKETAELEFNKTMVAEMRAEKERESGEALEKAKKMMLYRKGLIKDLHSAMATSKLIKDTTTSQEAHGCGKESETSPPFLDKICIKKMAWVNDRPVYEKKDQNKPCSRE